MESVGIVVAAWFFATAGFVGIPLACALWPDYRRVRTAFGDAARAVLVRRFFVAWRSTTAPLDRTLAGRRVWVELWSDAPTFVRAVATVTDVESARRELSISTRDGDDVEHRVRFSPRRESRRFAAGEGAATGEAIAGERRGKAVVIFF